MGNGERNYARTNGQQNCTLRQMVQVAAHDSVKLH